MASQLQLPAENPCSSCKLNTGATSSEQQYEQQILIEAQTVVTMMR